MAVTEERIKALNDLGFEWGLKPKTVHENKVIRVEQMKAFKETRGHNVHRFDKNLAAFCNNMRQARRNPGIGMTITEGRIKALDDLGFDWGLHRSTKQQAAICSSPGANLES